MMIKLRCYLRTVLLIAIGLSWFSGAMADLNDGLIAYYPFNGNALDASGNGNNGVVHGATLTEDRFSNAGNAYHFDGSDDFIQVTSTPLQKVHNSGEVSYTLWFEDTSDDDEVGTGLFHRGTGSYYDPYDGCQYEPVISTIKGPFGEELHYEADMQYEPLSEPMTFLVTGVKPK